MTKNEITEVLKRVHTWPKEQQERAARVLLELEGSDSISYRLTDEQVAEIRRRRAKQNAKYVPLAEARKRFHRLGV